MHRLAVLGCTGSIGTQVLDVISRQPQRFEIVALAAATNDALLARQVLAYQPQVVALTDAAAAARLQLRLPAAHRTEILTGTTALSSIAALPEVDMVVVAVVGFAGVAPTLTALQHGKAVALANKETLVAAGEMVMQAARRGRVPLLPVDSEHSAIFQCLQGEKRSDVEKIMLTASGGPFWGYTAQQLQQVTVEQALQHPNWSMGKKITVDSATLINKGLEVIEAHWLFGMDYDRIQVVIHPQSVVHSLVAFHDGVVMAQLGQPDMRIPIQYALTYPERLENSFPRLDLTNLTALTFAAPDETVFPGLRLAYEAGRCGGTMPCVLNAANEVAVALFLARRLSFCRIVDVIAATMAAHTVQYHPTVADLTAADAWARRWAAAYGEKIGAQR